MEGLRAPSIGKAFPKSATRVSGRAAAVATMAAASIGMGLGGVNASQYQPTVQVPASVQRSAASASQIAQMQASAAQGLLGNLAQKAPSLGPGAAATLNSAAGVAPTVARGIGGGALSGASNALGGAARALSPVGKFLGAPLNPLTAVLPDLLFPAGTQKAGDEAKAIQEADKALAKRDAERGKAARKGDKFGNGNNPNLKQSPRGSEPGVGYLVRYTSQIDGQAVAYSGSFNLTGPIGGVVKEPNPVYANYFNWYIPFGDGQLVRLMSNVGESASASITGIDRLSGGENAPILDTGDPGGGLSLPATNGDSPVLPTMPRSGSLPATASSSPAPTGAPTPADGVRNPANPSNPTPGATSPQPGANPLNPANPSQPGQGIQTQTPSLPGIPSAPTAGSASLTAPAFPSTFTQVPGIRNPDTFRQPDPPSPQPQRKPGCADPCLATIQNALPPLGESLEGLGELLAQLLAGQQEQEEQQNELTEISVPICNCRPDGSALMSAISLQVPQALATPLLELFTVIAANQRLTCGIERHTARAHNILGGDIWFKTPGGREPEYKVKLERKVRELGTLFGFPAIPDEDPVAVAIEEEQARLTGIPIPGQVKVRNIVSLLNAYTSNLYHRAGFQGLPTSVPRSLLGYTDADTPATVSDMATYFVWFVRQVDALIGKFPINITIEDIDPLTEGNQTKEIELPNISEALAEMYGLNISTSVNADVTVNFLMRLASEMIATKNSTLITQDYVRANAAFLGYKGNPARREVNYSFTPAKLDSLDEFLQESKGYLVGWEEDDKESVVGFLQRIVFSAGIIKAAFFRDSKRLLELQKEIESMMKGDKVNSDADWEALLALLNDETEYFNKDAIPFPRVREKPVPPPSGTPDP